MNEYCKCCSWWRMKDMKEIGFCVKYNWFTYRTWNCDDVKEIKEIYKHAKK